MALYSAACLYLLAFSSISMVVVAVVVGAVIGGEEGEGTSVGGGGEVVGAEVESCIVLFICYSYFMNSHVSCVADSKYYFHMQVVEN
jgi:hypothetical protein